ncbi:hypothetical protein ACOME3_002502 [Neoechinorhynchus agilis]
MSTQEKCLNLNVGVLGHVDSGKTSLCRVLSTCESTASFDRDPQSQARGITLDLGFSSFTEPAPPNLSCICTKVRFSLVDCPGHASLIRTIIGGAQIIDMMILVIDSVEGFQTQTGECMVIGEIACNKRLIVALNKVDLCADTAVNKLEKKVRLILEKRSSFERAEIVKVSAKNMIVQSLKDAIVKLAYVPQRSADDPFLFYIKNRDWESKGQGMILTGTVISGQTSAGSKIQLPQIDSAPCKIRSIQVFHEPVNKIIQGDRAGISVQLKKSDINIERSIACEMGFVKKFKFILASANLVEFFKRKIQVGQKLHLSVAYTTVICKILAMFHCNECLLNHDHLLLKEIDPTSEDLKSNVCRLAFHGRLFLGWQENTSNDEPLEAVRVFNEYERSGYIERLTSKNTAIAAGMFANDQAVQAFSGMNVFLDNGQVTVIEGPFGKKGKMVLRSKDELTIDVLKSAKCSLKYKRRYHTNKALCKIFQ